MFIDRAGAFGPRNLKHPIRAWAGYDPSKTTDGERPPKREAASLVSSARPAKAAARPAKRREPGASETPRFEGNNLFDANGIPRILEGRSGFTYGAPNVIQYLGFNIRKEADGRYRVGNAKVATLGEARRYAKQYREEHGYPHAEPTPRRQNPKSTRLAGKGQRRVWRVVR